MANLDIKSKRPLSPHLEIYKWSATMLMSILHRVTGVGLYLGTVLLAGWLIAAASGPEYYDVASMIFGSWIGRLILFGYTWAIMHHMLGGLRHFIWDFAAYFEPAQRAVLARATWIGSISLTLLIWIIAYAVR